MKFNIWNDFPQKPLPELLDFIVDNRGKTVPTVSQEEACEIVLIATNCIRNENLYPVYEKVRYISKETYEKWFRAHPISGDIIFVNKGTPGRICFCPENIDFCIAQDMMAFRVNSSVLYNKYLLAVLRSREMQEQIRITSVGDTIPHFKKEFLKELTIPLPPMDVQQIIGDYYFKLSEKIELNKKINENLEQQIQAILLNMIQQDSKKDRIETVKLGEYLYIKGRIGWKGLKKDEYLDSSDYRIINGESLTKDGIDWNKAGFISKERYDESPEIMLQVGDILLSKDGTIGKIGYVDNLDSPSTVASGIFVIRNIKPDIISTQFIYYLLKSKLFSAFIASRTEGSVIPHLYQKDFMEFAFPLPNADEMSQFDALTSPLFATVIKNLRENEFLTATRDALLPKLMNGEIDVSAVKI